MALGFFWLIGSTPGIFKLYVVLTIGALLGLYLPSVFIAAPVVIDLDKTSKAGKSKVTESASKKPVHA